MIKTIIFDWGGVLLDYSELLPYFARHLNVNEDAFRKAFQNHEGLFKTGRIEEDEFWKLVCQEVKVQKSMVQNERSLLYDGLRASTNPNSDMVGLVAELQKRGYVLGLISNTEKPATKFFKEQLYSKFFTNPVFSCDDDVQTMKPAKRIYQIALKKLNSLPEETIFIDDAMEYVEGAKQVGIRGILHVDYNRTKSTLEDILGIKL